MIVLVVPSFVLSIGFEYMTQINTQFLGILSMNIEEIPKKNGVLNFLFLKIDH